MTLRKYRPNPGGLRVVSGFEDWQRQWLENGWPHVPTHEWWEFRVKRLKRPPRQRQLLLPLPGGR